MTPPCGGSGTTSSNTSARVPGARDAAGRGRATRKCAAAGVAESGTLRVGRPRPAGARPRTPPRRPSPPRRAPTRAERAAGRGPSGRGAAARDPAPRLSGAPAATGSHPLARGRGRSALRPPRGLAVGVEGGWRWPRGRGGRARGRGGHRSPPDCAIVLRHNVAHALGRVPGRIDRSGEAATAAKSRYGERSRTDALAARIPTHECPTSRTAHPTV